MLATRASRCLLTRFVSVRRPKSKCPAAAVHVDDGRSTRVSRTIYAGDKALMSARSPVICGQPTSHPGVRTTTCKFGCIVRQTCW